MFSQILKGIFARWSALVVAAGCVALGVVAVGAELAIDMQRVRELRARVQNGEKLSADEQAYYDRGKLEWQRTHDRRQMAQPEVPPSRNGRDPTAEVRVRAREMFSVSEKTCPLEEVEATSSEGMKVIGVVRKPPGTGPFPVLINLHGTLHSKDRGQLRHIATQPTISRFLAAGYLIVAPTFRDREEDPQTRDALEDCLTIINWVKQRPDVDPKSVVIWGDSGGGSLALELAGETSLAAIAAQEPASILMIGILTKENPDKGPVMQDPKRYWTPELQTFAREKFNKIACPVFIAYGDKSEINKVNHEIVIPELKAAGKQLETKLYPGKGHGFSKSSVEFYEDASRFFAKHISTAPKPIEQP